MKLPIKLIMLLLAFSSASAAEKSNLQVSIPFTKAQGNVAGKLNSVKDKKGNDCALIVVQSAVPGLMFSSHVGEVRYDDSQYFVYLPPKTKNLEVSQKGYPGALRIQFDPLEPMATYKVGISHINAYGYLSVSTNPIGAEVIIDDSHQSSVTPFSDFRLPEGPHTLRIIKDRYTPKEIKIEIRNGRRLDINETLYETPDYGQLYRQYAESEYEN